MKWIDGCRRGLHDDLGQGALSAPESMNLLHIETGGREHPLHLLSSLHHAETNHIEQNDHHAKLRENSSCHLCVWKKHSAMPTKTVLEPSNTTITTKARIGERIDHHNPTIKEEKQKGTLQ